MCCALASCGEKNDAASDGGDTPAAATVKGTTETWGNITVDVPEGMTLKGGSILDADDPDVVNISKDDNAMNYFLITINDDEEGVKEGVETTRESNDGAADVSFEAGVNWTGVSYDFSGTPVMQVYGEFNGKYAVVQSYGFTPDDDVTKSILGSIKVAA